MGCLDGQVAVVTGANRGLGAEIAIRLAAAGADLAVSARDRTSLAATTAATAVYGGRVLALECDVALPESADAMARSVIEHYGRVDTVVANAGVAGPTKAMHEIEFDAWRECLGTDLDGVFLTLRGFIPSMISTGGGSLIAISSATGKRPLLGRTPYAAAKMGVIGLMRTLAMEVGWYGIRANSICPGAVDGPRIHAVFAAQAKEFDGTEEEASKQFTSLAAQGRLVEAREVAEACLFLASPAASGITGEDLNVSAGLVMY
jgi:NAD(P)-dependent dehydrogenase (short-subunit alcohol dehydrogenase family)